MQNIKCPNCGEVFQVDESGEGYTKIVQQVRNSEFEKELAEREQVINEKKENEFKLYKIENEKILQNITAQNELKFAEYKNEIETLKLKLENKEKEKEQAVTLALGEQQKVFYEKDREIDRLNNVIDSFEKENIIKQNSLKARYEDKIKFRDEEIERLKDFKARLSTKMVGESLEQHCLNQFNKIRATVFPSAYFEKDNDSRTGSKGDFIFRESSRDGTEFISIMFEMKNEMETTATKHKNEDFFKELDKDRREKGCEYAVLVSLLEADSDLYNEGIVDVSYRYKKMYVVRPQFFIPIITLLRDAALNSLEYKRELKAIKEQQLDLTNFEENINSFRTDFARNYRLASEKFESAIKEIDKSIERLQKVKDILTLSEKNLRIANDKAEDLTIKKLTKNAPSVRVMFDELKRE